MRRLAPALALLLLLPLLAGCFQIRTLLRLDRDGSGTIEETTLLGGMLASMIMSDSTATLFDLATFQARADSLGEGVRFVGVDTLEEGGFMGYRAHYTFEDVNAVRLAANESAFDMAGGDGAEEEASEPVTFAYTPGTLRIHFPRPLAEDTGEALSEDSLAALADSLQQQFQQQGALIRGLFAGAHLTMQVELPGAVTETTARYAADSTVTLADLEFTRLLDLMEERPLLFARLQSAQTSAERDALLRQLGDVEGVRFEPQDEIVVSFE